jgi:hypothetical protein
VYMYHHPLKVLLLSCAYNTYQEGVAGDGGPRDAERGAGEVDVTEVA